MRVTNSMMVNNMIYDLNVNLRKMNTQQSQLSTGKRVQAPSDDPVLASKILQYRSDLDAIDQYDRNVTDALAWMEVTESAIIDVNNVLLRARELINQASSETNGPEELGKIAQEIRQLKDQIISDGNASLAGRYVFSAFDKEKPFFKDDGSINLDITDSEIANRSEIIYEISVGEKIDVSTSGLDVFGFTPADTIMTQKLPSDSSTGTGATKAGMGVGIDFTTDFTSGTNDDAQVTIAIDGSAFNIDPAQLTVLNGSSNPIDKGVLLDVIREATNGSSQKLSDFADVYIDASGVPRIESKTFGTTSTVQFDYTADSGGGLTVASLEAAFGVLDGANVAGTNTVNASVFDGSKTVTDAEVLTNAAEWKNNVFFVTLNGQTEKIQIDSGATLNNVSDLQTALNTALNAKFPGSEVVASIAGSGSPVVFTTNNMPNDGNPPELQVEQVGTTESQLMKDFDDLISALEVGDNDTVSTFIKKFDDNHARLLTVQADIGARVNRLELVSSRLGENKISMTKLLSSAEDADMGEVIMKLKLSENVYRAALSTGARVIQPSLVDFLR